MSINKQEKEQYEIQEEKQIKNAVIDLLHNNEEVTHSALSKVTGISVSSIEKHSESIQTMLTKLKKAYTSPNFKS